MSLPKLVAEKEAYKVRVTTLVATEDFEGRQAVLLQFDKEKLQDRAAREGAHNLAAEIGEQVLAALRHPFTAEEMRERLSNGKAGVDIALASDEE